MQTSLAGRAAIINYEGLVYKAYLDSAGVPTIGVGRTFGVKMGQSITHDQALAFLQSDLASAEKCVNSCVTATLNQYQFDALVSFVFNLGCGRFRTSTLLKLLNAGDTMGAANQFLEWTRAGGKIVEGLVRRRAAERTMFLRPLPRPLETSCPK